MEKLLAGVAAVAAALSKDGIAKLRENVQQNFQFRGIDDIHNALSPLLVANGLLIVPRYTNVETRLVARKEGQTPNTFTTVHGTFRLLHTGEPGGQGIDCGPFIGEGMDVADKSTAKAMAVSYKYFAIQTFCIPVRGLPDTDMDETNYNDKPLTEAEIQGLKESLDKTTTVEGLKEALVAAFKVCRDANDPDAHKKIKSYGLDLQAKREEKA